MKKLRRWIMILCMLLVTGQTMGEISAATNGMSLTVGTTDNAKEGDEVTVRLIAGDNPGITTFATRLTYDDDYLEYTGATWADAITADANNVQMISSVTESSQPGLNISSILSNEYSKNGTLVTLNFRAKRAYTTMPVTVTVREVNDTSYNPVTVTTVIDANAKEGTGSSSKESSTSTEDTQTDSTTGKTENTQSSSKKSNTKKSSTEKSSTKTSKDKDSVDATPKTGTVDVRMVLASAIVLLVGVAGICIKVLRGKEE